MNGEPRCFSFLCDCNPETIIWIRRMHVTEDCTVHFSGTCMSCGKAWNNLTLKAEDVIQLASEAKGFKLNNQLN